MTTPLEVVTSETPNGLVVKLIGEAGLLIDPLSRELTRVSARRPARVVIDGSELRVVSSIAMGALLAFRRGIVAHGGEVRLAALQPLVLDALKRARLQDMFPIDDAVS